MTGSTKPKAVRYTNIADPPDNGCVDCYDLRKQRKFCPAHYAEWKRSGVPTESGKTKP